MTAPDRGTALVGTLVGVLVFLVFLFAAVQLLLALYATSTVPAVATDAARSVASRGVDHTDPRAVGVDAALRQLPSARRSLGAFGRQVRFDWTLDRDTIRLRVRAENRRLAIPGFAALDAFTHVDRTVVLRLETPT